MRLSTLFAALVASAVPATAQNSSSSAVLNSSTFVYNSTFGALVIVSLTAAEDTNDLFFRVNVPTAYDWTAIGIGAQMKGALTLITYPSKNGNSMILSPRQATGNNEPTYNKKIDCKIVDNANPQLGDQITLGIVCHNATTWSNPPLDLNSSKAPFMWAIGPPTFNNGSMWTDSPNTDLRIHSGVGTFTMDMRTATVSSNPQKEIPELGNLTLGDTASTAIKQTRNLKSPGHAVAMILAIIVLIPLDSILRLCIKSVKLHMIMMGLVTTLFSLGAGLGFAVSGMFNRSKSYNSAHQIIGLLVFILFFSQIPLGIVTMGRLKARASADQIALADDPHYNPPRNTHQPLYAAHLIIAAVIGLFTIINGGLGFKFALGGKGYNIAYAMTITSVFVVWLGVAGVRWMWAKRGQDNKEEEDYDRNTKAAIQHYQMEALKAQQQQGQQAPLHQEQGQQYPSVAIPRTYG